MSLGFRFMVFNSDLEIPISLQMQIYKKFD